MWGAATIGRTPRPRARRRSRDSDHRGGDGRCEKPRPADPCHGDCLLPKRRGFRCGQHRPAAAPTMERRPTAQTHAQSRLQVGETIRRGEPRSHGADLDRLLESLSNASRIPRRSRLQRGALVAAPGLYAMRLVADVGSASGHSRRVADLARATIACVRWRLEEVHDTHARHRGSGTRRDKPPARVSCAMSMPSCLCLRENDPMREHRQCAGLGPARRLRSRISIASDG
jgi:hypothetical protein